MEVLLRTVVADLEPTASDTSRALLVAWQAADAELRTLEALYPPATTTALRGRCTQVLYLIAVKMDGTAASPSLAAWQDVDAALSPEYRAGAPDL
jgi:hypothetical protein